MDLISTEGLRNKKRKFHDIEITVYEAELHIDDIQYWPDNNRTIFSFDELEHQTEKDLQDISVEEITTYLVNANEGYKIDELAKSIKRNGIHTPLLICNDRKLLDGNRRYFASYLLKMNSIKQGQDLPKVLQNIPVLIIRRDELDSKGDDAEKKILAQLHLAPDYRLPWSLDAQARAINSRYDVLTRNYGMDHDEAISKISADYGTKKSRVTQLIETLRLAEEFINETKDNNEIRRRKKIVIKKFVYFWEFLNKAINGKSRYRNKGELDEVKQVFFHIISIDPSPLKNVKQVEPLAHAKKIKGVWQILDKDKGSNLDVVVSMVNQFKDIRKTKDTILIFHNFLKTNKFDDEALNLIRNLSALIDDILKEQS